MILNVTDMKTKNKTLQVENYEAIILTQNSSRESYHPYTRALYQTKHLNTRGVLHTDYNSPQAIFTLRSYIG